jgi:hypothetical protein
VVDPRRYDGAVPDALVFKESIDDAVHHAQEVGIGALVACADYGSLGPAPLVPANGKLFADDTLIVDGKPMVSEYKKLANDAYEAGADGVTMALPLASPIGVDVVRGVLRYAGRNMRVLYRGSVEAWNELVCYHGLDNPLLLTDD